MNTCNNQMNQDQSEAIHHLTGPCIVIAPPGSGKTFTLTRRIKYLTTEAGVAPESILVITFTKAAAVQMKERYLSLIGETETAVSFGTFHAVYFGILRTSFSYDGGALLTQAQKQRILGEIMESVRMEKDMELPEPERIMEEVSRMKNQGKILENYEVLTMDKTLFRQIAGMYLRECQRERKLDFDDMVLLCKEALQNHKEILKSWQERFRYILVDEFQDINASQYEVLQMLAAPEDNLFMVGDDDQAIYGFRGSDPSLMLSLEQDYPQIRKILLKTNYRSAPPIIQTAEKLIDHNRLRFAKEIKPHRTERGKVQIEISENADRQNEAILNFIREIGEQSDTAIIARTNALLPQYAKLLSANGIAFTSKEKIRNPYEHMAVKDMEAYLRLAIGEASRSDFFRIMNKPLRYLSRLALPADMADWMKVLRAYYSQKPYMQRILKQLEEELLRIRQFSPFAAVNYIRRGIGYEEAVWKELTQEKEQQELTEMLDLVQRMSRTHDSHRGFLREIERKRQEFEQAQNQRGNEWMNGAKSRSDQMKMQNDRMREEYRGITLITMHGAKGLEYENVILPDLNEKIVPHKKAYLPEAVEEERRVLYVAITRAKQRLFMSCIKKEGDEKKEISRFVKELQAPGRNISF